MGQLSRKLKKANRSSNSQLRRSILFTKMMTKSPSTTLRMWQPASANKNKKRKRRRK